MWLPESIVTEVTEFSFAFFVLFVAELLCGLRDLCVSTFMKTIFSRATLAVVVGLAGPIFLSSIFLSSS